MSIESTPATQQIKHLALFLEMGVPLAILELQKKGGPSRYDYKSIETLGSDLAQYGDRLMFNDFNRPKKKPKYDPDKPWIMDSYRNTTGSLAGRLAKAIGIMAFNPGGIKIFGMHWTAESVFGLPSESKPTDVIEPPPFSSEIWAKETTQAVENIQLPLFDES